MALLSQRRVLLGVLALLAVLTIWALQDRDPAARSIRDTAHDSGSLCGASSAPATLGDSDDGGSRELIVGRGADHDTELECGTRHRLSVTALEVGTGHPVEGVTVEILAPGMPRDLPIARVVTDSRGGGTTALDPAGLGPRSQFLVRATHSDMLALGYPKLVGEIPSELEVEVARRVRLEGRVLDPQGRPRPDALVALGQESESRDLSARQLAVSDQSGWFSSDYTRTLATRPHLFASHPDYPPAYAELDLEDLVSTGSATVVLQFVEGIDVVLNILDTDGLPVPGCRVGLVTARHPLLDRGATYIGSLAQTSGVKSLRGVTNEGGVLESKGWPPGAAIRVVVYSERSERRVVASVSPGRVKSETEAIAEVEGRCSSISLTIDRIPNVEVKCRGTAVGFSSADKEGLRISLEDERGMSWGGAIDWDHDSSFQITFVIKTIHMRPDATHFIVDRSRGSDAHFGPYRIVGPADLGSIELRR